MLPSYKMNEIHKKEGRKREKEREWESESESESESERERERESDSESERKREREKLRQLGKVYFYIQRLDLNSPLKAYYIIQN